MKAILSGEAVEWLLEPPVDLLADAGVAAVRDEEVAINLISEELAYLSTYLLTGPCGQ